METGGEDCAFCQIASEQTDTEVLLSVSVDWLSNQELEPALLLLTSGACLSFPGLPRMRSCCVSGTSSRAPHTITSLSRGLILKTAKAFRGTTCNSVQQREEEESAFSTHFGHYINAKLDFCFVLFCFEVWVVTRAPQRNFSYRAF